LKFPTSTILNNLPQDTEAEPELPNKIEYLNNTLAALKTEIDEKTTQTEIETA
jgi:hypothetical protein